MKKVTSIISVLSFLTVLSVQAQFSTKGLFVKPHLTGTSWELDDFDFEAETGGGGGLTLGYGFSDIISVFLEASAAQIEPDGGDSYILAHADLGIQATLGSPSSAFKFYVNGALSGRAAEFDYAGLTIEANGSGYSVGGGIYYFFSSSLGLDAGLQATFGTIDEIKMGSITEDVSIDATSARVNLGLVWYPGR